MIAGTQHVIPSRLNALRYCQLHQKYLPALLSIGLVTAAGRLETYFACPECFAAEMDVKNIQRGLDLDMCDFDECGRRGDLLCALCNLNWCSNHMFDDFTCLACAYTSGRMDKEAVEFHECTACAKKVHATEICDTCYNWFCKDYMSPNGKGRDLCIFCATR